MSAELDDIDADGLPRGKDCPACGLPLEPGHTDDTPGLTWFCPSHGAVEFMHDPFADLT